ncbi:MAG: hypothetical protein ACI4FY_11785 [Acetatifactor sp.]
MRLIMKKIWFLLTLQLFLLLLVGCGKEEEPVIPEAGDRTIITLDSNYINAAIARCISRFNETNPDYYVYQIDYKEMTHDEFLDARALKILSGRRCTWRRRICRKRLSEKGVQQCTPFFDGREFTVRSIFSRKRD